MNKLMFFQFSSFAAEGDGYAKDYVHRFTYLHYLPDYGMYERVDLLNEKGDGSHYDNSGELRSTFEADLTPFTLELIYE